MCNSVLVNLLGKHSGKWFEVVVFSGGNEDQGEVIAKFTSGADALWFAKTKDAAHQQTGGYYTAIVVR